MENKKGLYFVFFNGAWKSLKHLHLFYSLNEFLARYQTSATQNNIALNLLLNFKLFNRPDFSVTKPTNNKCYDYRFFVIVFFRF